MAEDPLVRLREDIAQMLDAGLHTDEQHVAEMERRDELHVAETDRRDALHVEELHRRDDLHAHELGTAREALETRDIIGQAKGVIMATLACSPDEAFNMLRKQSQAENRKLIGVAAEIANRAWKRPGAPPASA